MTLPIAEKFSILMMIKGQKYYMVRVFQILVSLTISKIDMFEYI